MNARTPLLAVPALALALASTACQAPAQEAGPLSEEDVAAIQALDNSWAEAELAGNWNGVGAVMAEDVVLMPPGMPTMTGRAAFLEWAESQDMSFSEVTATAVEIEGQDGLAYLRGTYSQTYTVGGVPEPISMTGKHLAILRKQPDGSWLVTVWIWNLDLPLLEEGSET
jgi:ketosteroid isomerase-like protein